MPVTGHLLGVRGGVTYSGPLMDFRARRAFARMRDEVEEEGAEFALDHVKSSFHRNFKNPTGFYESNVRIHNTSAGPEVWDGGMAGPVYGPWLEGVGSRNSVTRFKGYHAFRHAAMALEARIEGIADRVFNLRTRGELE